MPIEHVLEEAGFDRAVVVLTQDRSYVKGPYDLMAPARARYGAYPYFLDALENRHERYNAQREHIWEYERQGRALVVAPPAPVRAGKREGACSTTCARFSRRAVRRSGATRPNRVSSVQKLW